MLVIMEEVMLVLRKRENVCGRQSGSSEKVNLLLVVTSNNSEMVC